MSTTTPPSATPPSATFPSVAPPSVTLPSVTLPSGEVFTAVFPVHGTDTAPAAAVPTMTAVAARFGGRLPAAVGRLATSPELLSGFLTLTAIFDTSTLPAVDREIVIMTVATRNGCDLCVAMHTATLRGLHAPAELIDALRTETAVADPRHAALQRFTHTVMDTAGEVPAEDLTAFLAAGYTARNALDVVLGIGTYTMSTFANRLVRSHAESSVG